MSDKIQKFLTKLSAQELERIVTVNTNIEAGRLDNLNIKPIKGKKATTESELAACGLSTL